MLVESGDIALIMLSLRIVNIITYIHENICSAEFAFVFM
jgi:hypothetical protein